MSISDSNSSDKKFYFVSVFKHNRRLERYELDESYRIMRKWCTDRLKVHKDYTWSRDRYEVQHRYGVSTYPHGVYFVNPDDALAFKMAFGI